MASPYDVAIPDGVAIRYGIFVNATMCLARVGVFLAGVGVSEPVIECIP